MQGGIAISFIKMKHIGVDDSGESAGIGPGLTNGELVRDFAAQGKQTSGNACAPMAIPRKVANRDPLAAGICMCTGITGIMIGGGHGYLQRSHGLLADQILEARVVLADGSRVAASPDENRDLFWPSGALVITLGSSPT